MMTLTIIPVLCPFHDPNDLPELFYAPVIDCAATQDALRLTPALATLLQSRETELPQRLEQHYVRRIRKIE